MPDGLLGQDMPSVPTTQDPLAEVQTVDTELEEATGATAKPVKGGRRAEMNRELSQIHQLPQGKKEAALFDLAARRGYKRGWAQRIWEIWQTSRQNRLTNSQTWHRLRTS